MDHDLIVEQLLDRCKGMMENILQAPDLHNVGSASLAIFAQMRQVAWEILQAKITLEAQQRRNQDVARCCPEVSVTYVHIRSVSPQTLLGEITIPARTFQCRGCGATFRPDDAPLGVPEAGDFTDDVRCLYAPVAAELPHRVAQSIINSTAEDLQRWQATRETQETQAVADAHFPGVRQTSDYYHLSEHLYAFAQLPYPYNPAGAQVWVEEKTGALLTDRVGDVLGALERTQPWKKAVCKALAQLIGYVERNWTRIRYQEPWQSGLAVGSRAVEGACKHVIQSRFKRAGMRWKHPGFLNVLALRIAQLNATLQAFWASRGLVIQASG